MSYFEHVFAEYKVPVPRICIIKDFFSCLQPCCISQAITCFLHSGCVRMQPHYLFSRFFIGWMLIGYLTFSFQLCKKWLNSIYTEMLVWCASYNIGFPYELSLLFLPRQEFLSREEFPGGNYLTQFNRITENSSYWSTFVLWPIFVISWQLPL